jgi:hypothetical protein
MARHDGVAFGHQKGDQIATGDRADIDGPHRFNPAIDRKDSRHRGKGRDFDRDDRRCSGPK